MITMHLLLTLSECQKLDRSLALHGEIYSYIYPYLWTRNFFSSTPANRTFCTKHWRGEISSNLIAKQGIDLPDILFWSIIKLIGPPSIPRISLRCYYATGKKREKMAELRYKLGTSGSISLVGPDILQGKGTIIRHTTVHTL